MDGVLPRTRTAIPSALASRIVGSPAWFWAAAARHPKLSHRSQPQGVTDGCWRLRRTPTFRPTTPTASSPRRSPSACGSCAGTWASQVQATPKSVMALYWAKYLFVYIGGWAVFQTFNANYPGLHLAARVGVHGHRVPEGGGVVDLLRAHRHRLRLGTDERALQADVRRLPPLPAPGHDEAAAVPGPSAVRRHPAHLARRGALRGEPAVPAARADRARDHARAALAERRADPADGDRATRRSSSPRAPSTTRWRSRASRSRSRRTARGSRPASSSGASSGSGPRPRRSTTTSRP